MPASPSTLNYFEGKGTLSWTPTGGSARDLGNAPSFRVVPSIETRQHRSSRTGVSTVDRTVITSKAAAVEITLDEITIPNLALGLLGTESTNSDGDAEMEILDLSEVKGALTLTGTNDIGNRFTVVIPTVSFVPGEGFDFIGDDFGVITLNGEAAADGVTGSFGTITETRIAT